MVSTLQMSEKIEAMSNQNQPLLKIMTKTWSRDSHGLFDYEAMNTKNNLMILNSRSKIVRKKNDVKQVMENTELELDERELARIKYESSTNKYTLSSPVNFGMLPTEENINDLQNKIWYVIKQEDGASSSASSSSNDIYDIKINDIIKLGRVKYAITEIKINDSLLTIDKNVERPVFSLICDYKKTIELNPDMICKICLSHGEEDSNPMVNLCKCSGSISCVHFLCLKSWMNTKLSTKENEKKTVTLYSMKSFNCEICKTPYPLRFRSENNFFDIIDYTRPLNKNYIILESLNQLKDNNNYKSIQVITLDENEKIVMGRGHETDVRINDISVSRTHAVLTFFNKKVYIKDLKSKFGTLVLVQNEIEATDKLMSLQIGRTYADFIVITQKEFQKIKKELAIKSEDKNLNQIKNSRQLFQVEKLDKKEFARTKNQSFSGMDVDNINNIQQIQTMININLSNTRNNLNNLTNLNNLNNLTNLTNFTNLTNLTNLTNFNNFNNANNANINLNNSVNNAGNNLNLNLNNNNNICNAVNCNVNNLNNSNNSSNPLQGEVIIQEIFNNYMLQNNNNRENAVSPINHANQLNINNNVNNNEFNLSTNNLFNGVDGNINNNNINRLNTNDFHHGLNEENKK